MENGRKHRKKDQQKEEIMTCDISVLSSTGLLDWMDAEKARDVE